MTWSTIRKATDEDYDKLEKRAKAFAKRHDLDIDEDLYSVTPDVVWDTLQYDVLHSPYPQDARRLLSLWKRIVRRALRHSWAEGIAYGYVGFRVD
jgi:hypothetical protein